MNPCRCNYYYRLRVLHPDEGIKVLWRVIVSYRREEEGRLKQLLEDKPYPTIFTGSQVTVYVPDSDIEEFLTSLENTLDMRYKENTIAADRPSVILGGPAKRLQSKTPGEKPVDELLARAERDSRIDPGKTLLTGLAAYIAMIGLWLDSPAIVIGAMLLSPLLSPLYALSINIVFGKPRQIALSTANLAALTASAYILVLLTSLGLHTAWGIDPPLNNEILSRTQLYKPIYAVLSVLLGYSALLATRKDVAEAIAGVAVAAALLPPLAVSALLLPVDAGLSLLSLDIALQNILGIIAGIILAVITLGIRPRRSQGLNKLYTATTLLAVFVLLGLLQLP